MTQAARAAVSIRGGSREAARLHADLMAVAPGIRREFLSGLTAADLAQVLAIATAESGTPYGMWSDDPVGFIELVLGEALWSKPKQIMSALPDRQRIAVPSCFGSSKTWSSSRAVLWMCYTRPPGHALAVTIAPQWRQVVRQVWPEIRHAHAHAGLHGSVDMAQLKIPDASGMDHVAAYGIAAPPWNEVAVQGIHARGGLLLVVDEAGGISPVIGKNLRGMLVGSDTHMLCIGNPPTDDEGTWFEQLCSADDVFTVPIPASATPNLSGEVSPRCRTCPPELPAHRLAEHLVDQAWVNDTIAEHGEDAAYVQAKVFARFPKGGPGRVIPSSWIDAAMELEEPDDDTAVVLADLGLPEETAPYRVHPGDWVRLGVDVAAAGGDELAVARSVGDLVTLEHHSSGTGNANAVDVAGKVLEQIRRAERVAAALGSPKVRVKIDGIGVGWGVSGVLQAWGTEGMHDAEIVPVVVSEATDRQPDVATMRPYRKRDEMWLAMRALVQPTRPHPEGTVRLRVDARTAAQLRTPALSYNSGGYAVVESKASMLKRGVSSPDRAEAVILARYEPAGPRRKRARLIS